MALREVLFFQLGRGRWPGVLPGSGQGVCRVCRVAVSDVLALSHCILRLHVIVWKPVHFLGIRSMCDHRRRRRRLGRMVTMLIC